MRINIFGNRSGLPASIDEGQINGTSQRTYLALILAQLAALFGVAKLAKVIAASAFTRPSNTTAYASGDLVANSVTNTSVTPISLALARTEGGTVQIRRARLLKSQAGTTNAAFRVHFFTSSPTVTNGDNGAFEPAAHAGYVGSVDIPNANFVGFTAGAQGNGAPLVGQEITATAASGSKVIYALVEAKAAYTPASAETFTLTVEALQS